jgi:hypothetical protein
MTPTAINVALWVANQKNVLEIIPSQTGVSDPAPRVTLNSATFIAPQGVQFDVNGDLWVLDGGCQATPGNGSRSCSPQGSLDEFTPAQLAAHQTTPKPVPNKTIVYPGIQVPQQGVFDEHGDFWVTDSGANEVIEFTPVQLAAGGSITPNLTLTSTVEFDGPLGIAFSPVTGELWVANNGHTLADAGTSIPGTSIEGFAAASLVGLAGPHLLKPHDVLNDDGNQSIQAPWALAFDSSGNLWSSNSSNPPSTIVEFSSNELVSGVSSRSPVQNITIAPVPDEGKMTLQAPNGLAFDNLGGLWAVNSAMPLGIPLFAAWQLATGGPTTPSIFLVGDTTMLKAPTGDVFGPAVP